MRPVPFFSEHHAMTLFRRAFYLAIGLTFPGFWVVHAAGFGAFLYRPLQSFFHSNAVGWPSLITALLLYMMAIICFETCFRLLRSAHP